MKKISAAFDGLKFSDATLAYAIEAAVKSKAVLSGVFLDDFLYHSYHLYDMVGSRGVSGTKMNHLNQKDKETRNRAVQSFEDACKNASVKHIIHRDKSFALQELLKETVYSDLLIINTAETFTHFADEEPTQFITGLLADTQCPVLVTPEKFQPIERLVLLYDGKPSAVYAIKMFNYLMPWLAKLPVEVLTVMEPEELALPDDTLIKEFIQCHYPQAKYTVLHGNAKEQIVNYLKQASEPALVVSGAYRRNNVSMWFNTSMADVLMKELDMPLFIAHNK
ncbi:universal stress protein [Mucilaginibacter sp. RS28]|uniref:Universal stress protein n=1 Tax=Mucilaginibacter straminoryzae TaxID=2932774 RepID=A0A9X1X4E1_9SPHI|nr:universal stress protein [Mucilaginibacter straminoryzae]MCJ8208354.1 universal stress protein [Mucilaginibacter straminoryzae]